MKALLLLVFFSFPPSFRSPPGGGGGGAGIGLVSGQLYNNFDDLVRHHNLPIALIDKNSDDANALKENKDLKSTKAKQEKFKTVTCLAAMHEYSTPDSTSDYVFSAESRDYFRSQGSDLTVGSGYNPHYFCSNVPKFTTGGRLLDISRDEGYITPHSKFWMKEPTAWHWSRVFYDQSGLSQSWNVYTGHILMKAKDMGFIFRVDVTGIKAGKNFLKGWYHLKISLDIDHNIKNHNNKNPLLDGVFDPYLPYICHNCDVNITAKEQMEKDAKKNKADYVIDKLMVTARGRILAPGKPPSHTGNPHPSERGPARRAWVGGIGEFVQDFPECSEGGEYNRKYVTQQFMPCGAVQYSESQYGNNFYYTRGGEAKYDTAKGQTVKEIHLNFRLDNSFCNRYYDLDFIANGIVMKKGAQPVPGRGTGGNFVKSEDTYVVQRSISTRFVFASSHEKHGPSYYENADPIPRGVDSVTCNEQLQGLYTMEVGEGSSKDEFEGGGAPGEEFSKDDPVGTHTISVTQGADLKAAKPPPDASSTFGGSIKFVYKVPIDLITYPCTESFACRRRTWTYPEPFVQSIAFNRQSMWAGWRDHNEHVTYKGYHVDDQRFAIHTAVQRVLHEFDWETWRAWGRVGSKNRPDYLKNHANSNRMKEKWQHSGFPTDVRQPNPQACAAASNVLDPNCQGWCSFSTKGEAVVIVSLAQYWPHAYYDATCIGLDAAHYKQSYKNDVRDLINHVHAKKRTIVPPSKFQNTFPPILGRCRTDLHNTDGVGHLDTAPPPCNQFFNDYEANPKRTVDPALGRVYTATMGSARPHWGDKYGAGVADKEKTDKLCKVINELNKDFKSCPSIGIPQPYTSPPPPDKKARAELAFRQTKAYNRGMMVAENPYSLYVYDSRVLHGIAMTIIVMFITPVSIFLARYYKETFMDSRVFLHRVWYFVHIAAAFLTPLLFLVAMWRLVGARAILGVSLSKTGTAHRILGWMAIGIAVFLTFLGGIRCVNRVLRAILILLHFVMGFAFYLISLGLIMVSVAIPGSPSTSSFRDFSLIGTENNGETDGDVFKNLFKEPIFLILFFWIVFDLAMHIFLTVMQCLNDRKMKLTRRRFCFGAMIPVLVENFRFDSPGRFLRIWVLRVYLIVALGVTIAICVLIRLNSPRGRGFGFMSCTHTNDKNHAVITSYNETTCYVDTDNL